MLAFGADIYRCWLSAGDFAEWLFFDPTCRCGNASRVKFCLAGMVCACFEGEMWLGREVLGVLPRFGGECIFLI